MKRSILLAAMTLLTFIAGAQTDFKVTDNGLVWQKVYQSDLSSEDIMNKLYNSGSVSDIGSAEGIITCRIPLTPIDFEGAGFSRGSIPMYLILNDMTAFATIQIKDGRYRVTVENMYLVSNMATALGAAGERTNLAFFAIKRGQPSKQLQKYIEPIIGRQLDNIFSLKKDAILTDDNW